VNCWAIVDGPFGASLSQGAKWRTLVPMNYVFPILILLLGIALGGAGVWLLLRAKIAAALDRGRGESAAETAALSERLVAREDSIGRSQREASFSLSRCGVLRSSLRGPPGARLSAAVSAADSPRPRSSAAAIFARSSSLLRPAQGDAEQQDQNRKDVVHGHQCTPLSPCDKLAPKGPSTIAQQFTAGARTCQPFCIRSPVGTAETGHRGSNVPTGRKGER